MKWISFLVIALMLLLTSCRDSVRDLDTDTSAAQDHLLSQTLFLDVFRQIHRMAIEDSLLIKNGFQSDLEEDCVDTIYFTTSPTARNKELWIDYGTDTAKIACEDGKTRFGRINVTIDGFYPDDFNVMTLNLFGYKVDDYEINGTFEYTLIGTNSEGEKVYNLKVIDGFSEFGINDKIVWNCDYYVEQIDGNDLPKPFDDVFEFRGEAEGRGTKGSNFTVEVSGNVFFDLKCIYPYGAGVEEMDIESLTPRFIQHSEECEAEGRMTNVNVTAEPLTIDY